LVIIFIFAFTGVYLKYASVSQQLIAQVQVTQDGGNKLAAKGFDSNFHLLVCRLGRAPWETRMASGWRGYVWALKKSGAFRDGLQTSSEIHVNKFITHMCRLYFVSMFARCICQQGLLVE
jgi:hypothetical protein